METRVYYIVFGCSIQFQDFLRIKFLYILLRLRHPMYVQWRFPRLSVYRS